MFLFIFNFLLVWATGLFDQGGLASPVLLELMEKTGIEFSSPLNVMNVSKTVERWKRPPGKERWEIDIPSWLDDRTAEFVIHTCTKTLKMADPVYPAEETEINGILFLGALLKTVQARMEFLKEFLKRSPLYPIWILSGKRALTEEEKQDLSGTGIVNEFEMIMHLFHRDPILSERRIIGINSPPEAGCTRATTYSTVEQFIEELKPERNRTYNFLAISDQPFVYYQQSVIDLAFKKLGWPNIRVKVIGPRISQRYEKMPEPHKAAVLLDLLAKQIGNEAQMN